MSEEAAAEAAQDLHARVQQYTTDFFAQCQIKHDEGEREYGQLQFFDSNTLIEAMDQVCGLANYAMYTYIKLRMINDDIQKLIGDQPEMLGPSTFMKG